MIWPYFVGGLLPGLVAAIAGYYLLRPLIAAYQTRRRARMLARAHDRLVAAKAGLTRRADAAYKPERTGPGARPDA